MVSKVPVSSTCVEERLRLGVSSSRRSLPVEHASPLRRMGSQTDRHYPDWFSSEEFSSDSFSHHGRDSFLEIVDCIGEHTRQRDRQEEAHDIKVRYRTWIQTRALSASFCSRTVNVSSTGAGFFAPQGGPRRLRCDEHMARLDHRQVSPLCSAHRGCIQKI
jgi:hypothetical protein